MSDSLTISRRACVLVLAGALVAAQSAVFLAGRTLLPIAPSYTSVPAIPFGYTGPISKNPSAIDPAGSLNVSYVFDFYSARAFREWTLPFWNPYQGLGQPQLANGLSAVLYPLNVLLLLIPHAWWDVVYLVNWLLAAIFVTEYLRLLGCRREGVLVGGVAVLGSGFFQYYLAMREVVAVAAWFPLLLYAVERTAREPRWRHRHWVFAVAVGCCLTAGQPESSFVALALAALYALATMAALGADRWRFARECLPGAVGGLLASAPFWVSFADYAFTAFSNHPAGSHMSHLALHWRTAAAYLSPMIFGAMHTVPVGTPVPGWNWDHSPGWMTIAVGLLAFMGLPFVTRDRRRQTALIAAMGLLIAAKIWDLPGSGILTILPLFDRIVYPRYAAFVLAISASILAGVGFDRLHAMDRGRAAVLAFTWTGITLGLYVLARVWALPVFGSEEVRLYSLLFLAWSVLVPTGLVWIKWRGRDEVLALAAGLAALLELAAFMPGYGPNTYLGLTALTLGMWCAMVLFTVHMRLHVRPALAVAVALGCGAFPGVFAAVFAPAGLPRRYDVLKVPPYIEQLREYQRDGARVYALDGTPQPNFGAAFRVSSINTLETLAPAGSAAFVNNYLDRGADPLWLSGPTGGRRGNAYTPAGELVTNSRYFDLIGVRYLTTTGASPGPALYDTAGQTSEVPILNPMFTSLESWVTSPVATAKTIEVYLSTFALVNPGVVRLAILDSKGDVLGESTLRGERIHDNSYAAFPFSGLPIGVGTRIRLRLSFEPTARGSMVAAWGYRRPGGPTFVFRIPDGSIRNVFTDPSTGVAIWDRPSAVPRVFLASAARVVNDARTALKELARIGDLRREVLIDSGPGLHNDAAPVEPGELLECQISPNRVRIRYRAQTAGILTLTDSYDPGWRATVNGGAADILRVDGVFRGVRVPGAGDYLVEYTYRPPRWTLSCGLAAAGLTLVGVLTVRRA